jgi:DNA-binding beta-propeller fold protein YncE
MRIPLLGGPCDIAVHPAGWAYVSRVDAAAVERLDLSTGAVIGSVPTGPAPCCFALDVAGGRAFVSTHYEDAISVIDMASHTRVGSLPLPGDPFPLRLAPSGRTLYVTTNEDRLYAIAVPSGRIVASLALPATSHHLAVHPSGSRLYVATRTAGSVLEIDTTRYQLLRTFPLRGWPQGLAVSGDGSTLYVANEKLGVDMIRLASGQVVAGRPLDGGPCELALSPDQQRLYVGLVHGGQVVVIDCRSFTVAEILDVGGEPRGMAFDPRGHAVAIANRAGWVDLRPLSRIADRGPGSAPLVQRSRAATG